MSKFGSISALWGTVDNTRSCLRYKTSALRSKHFALLGYSYGLNLGWQTDIRQISCPCVPFFFFKTNNVLLKQYFISVYVFYLFGVLLFFFFVQVCDCICPTPRKSFCFDILLDCPSYPNHQSYIFLQSACWPVSKLVQMVNPEQPAPVRCAWQTCWESQETADILESTWVAKSGELIKWCSEKYISFSSYWFN